MHRHIWLLALGLLVTGCSSMTAAGPSERGGLGTAWGETRDSPVHWVRFQRADPTPFAVTVFYYDDAEGVNAMMGDARAYPPGDGARVAGGMLSVRLLDGYGMPLPTLMGVDRQYVVGRDGERYAIEIVNRTDERIEAVATVDGLDAMDGGRGSIGKRGYVLERWSSYRIDGFRRSDAEVAAFRFGAVDDSYAARKGDDRNVGVIGVAFFAERGARPQWFDRETARRHRADPFPGRFAEPPP
jgi:hypothetical protein